MGSTGFDLLAQAGVQNKANEAAERLAEKQQQRNTVAALYLNAIQTPLPKTDDPAYKEALQKREDLMRQYVATVGPEQHASFGQRLHGLIFGEPETAEPVHGQPPTPAQPDVPAQPPSNAQPASQSDHPFAHNPVYAKIQEGLDGLGKHLKAFAHPLPPPAQPDYATLAAAPTAEERKEAVTTTAAAQKQKDAMELQRLRNQGRPQTELNRFLDSFAAKIGKPMEDWTPEDFDAANKEFAASRKAPATPSQAALAVYLRSKYGPNPTAEQIEEGTRAHQQMMSGIKLGADEKIIFDDMGVPHKVVTHSEHRTDFGAPKPTSSQAPSLAPVNAKIAAGNAHSKKLNKGKPTSSQAPNPLGFTKGNPLVKSDSAQYTKVAEDANTKEEAFKSAQKALAAGSTPSSDQELIYAWVRSNVQGAGRMTQAEFKQAASIGSLDQRAQNWYNRTLTGKLTPEIEQMMFADIKRSYETSRDEANTLRQRLHPGGDTSAGPKVGDTKKFPNGKTGVWDGQGYVLQGAH